MQTTSELYKSLWGKKNTTVETKAVINGEDYFQDRIFDASASFEIFSNGTVGAGNAVSRQLNLFLRNVGTIPRAAGIQMYVRLVNGLSFSEWIPKGVYYIDTRNQQEDFDKLEIHAYDAIRKADVPFAFKNIEIDGPAKPTQTLGNILDEDFFDVNGGVTLRFGGSPAYQVTVGTYTKEDILEKFINDLAESSSKLVQADYDESTNSYTVTNLRTGKVMEDTSSLLITTSGGKSIPFDDIFKNKWPLTDIAVVRKIARRIGAKEINFSRIDPRTEAIMTNGYLVQYPGYGENAYTVREVLGFIGSMYAGNWVTNDVGQLRLLVLGDIPTETNYLTDENGDAILIGGDKILV